MPGLFMGHSVVEMVILVKLLMFYCCWVTSVGINKMFSVVW